jgi:dihydrofolate reductase
MKDVRINLIAALGARNRVIGANGGIPWRIPADQKRFRELTIGHPVIMGRKTWESIPETFRPLPGRTNIVITRNPAFEAAGATVVGDYGSALVEAAIAPGSADVYVIGGEQVYREAIVTADRLCLTLVDDETPGDAFFPPYSEFTKIIEEIHVAYAPPFSYLTLERE